MTGTDAYATPLDLTPLKAIQGVDGWLFEPEALFLHDLAATVSNGCIVEIGSYRGRSTIMLAQGARKAGVVVYAIDPHFEALDGIAAYGAADRTAFVENIENAGVADIVRKFVMTSEQAHDGWYEPIGMLWIDGAHDYESIKQDVELWTRHVVTGGIVAFHDSGFESVQRVQAELPSSFQLIAQVNSTRAYRKHGVDVTVLIPAYNCEHTISRAMQSALSQSGVNVQLSICDDGSTDDTLPIILATMEALGIPEDSERIHLFIHAENQGQVYALQTCCDYADGRYFIELDADDWYEPGALAKLTAALDAVPENIGFAYGMTQYHGALPLRHQPRPYKQADFYSSFPALYAFMYRREAWDAGCRYTPHVEIDGRTLSIQDWDMALQLIEYMRYNGLCLRETLVLHYSYAETGTVGGELKANADVLMPAFRARWPRVTAEGL